MDHKSIATQLLRNVENMVDPRAPVEQQLAQMRAQMAALSELPNIIQKKLECVNKNICQISMKESMTKQIYQEQHQAEIRRRNEEQSRFGISSQPKHSVEITELEPGDELYQKGIHVRVTKPSLTEDELNVQKEQLRQMGQQSIALNNQKPVHGDQRNLPREKPTPASGQRERPLYLPGGRRWKMSEYDENQISETLVGQAEVIKGNAIGVNFKKFEKPPIGLDHLKNSEVYRAVHNMDEAPLKRVELLGPAIAASEIRERVRSMSPAIEGR